MLKRCVFLFEDPRHVRIVPSNEGGKDRRRRKKEEKKPGYMK
ncbi:hypothetical protein [Methanocalculus sp.]|nr:hypothetical protein [Methanocalculus sp.]